MTTARISRSVLLPEDLWNRLEALGREEGTSVEQLVNALLSKALSSRIPPPPSPQPPPRLKWHAVPMKPRIKLEDGQTLQDLLDQTSF